MSICRMGKPSYNRGNQAMAPGEQNARPGVKTLVNFRFVIVFSLFVFFFRVLPLYLLITECYSFLRKY